MERKIIVIFVCTLFIASLAAIPTSSTNLEKTDESESFIVRELDVPGKGFCVKGHKIENAFSPIARPLSTDEQVTSSSSDEVHPTIATDSMGNYIIAYEGTEDGHEQEIYASVSTDFGDTWTQMGKFVLGGTYETYPSFDYANDRYYGAFTPDETDDQGGIQYLVIIENLTDPMAWEIWWWVWGTWYNCSDRESSEIASDYYDGINPWQYGVIAFVHTGLDDGTYRCPVYNYADDANEGYGWYYFWYLEDCGGAACEIDRTTDWMYAAYHWEDKVDGDYEIVYMKDDFTNMWPDGPGGILYEIESSTNDYNPTVAADDDNVMIICESEGAGGMDVICYYSSNGGSSWDISTVAGTGDFESSPDAVSTGGKKASCTFLKSSGGGNTDLYVTKTDDGGATWSTPVKVNDVAGSLGSNYRSAEICEFGTAWMDDRTGNFDIYFDLLNDPPGSPTITGPNTGVPGTEYTFKLNAVDPDNDNVRYHINWGDGDYEITSFSPSGSDLSAKHSWAVKGTYTIKVQAEDTIGLIGPENTKQVTIPRNRAVNYNIKLLNQLFEQIPNAFPIIRYILGL